MKMPTLLMAILIFGSLQLLAAQPKDEKKARVIKSKLSTEHDFEDKLVTGKYQYPDEATVTVDDEKILDDLVGVRKEFKDRLKQSAERR